MVNADSLTQPRPGIKLVEPLCCKLARLTLIRGVVEAHCVLHGATERSAGWQPIETMPESRTVEAMTITGLIRLAMRPRGYRVRSPRGPKPARLHCWGRAQLGSKRYGSLGGSADLTVIAWREPAP